MRAGGLARARHKKTTTEKLGDLSDQMEAKEEAQLLRKAATKG